jgi:RNA polymerase sigma-70 factor (ECF subfamily)
VKSDSELIEEALEGDTSSYGLLVTRYKNSVHNMAYRMMNNAEDAEDIAQEAFISAYRSLDRFDTNRRFSPWLFRITINLCIDHLRRQRYRPIYIDDEGTYMDEGESKIQIPDSSPDPQMMAETAEIREIIEGAIAGLSPKYRAVLMLRYLEDFTYAEISEALDVSTNTVKTHLHRGREILKRKIKPLLREEL